ncbi:MAG: Gfo/Idh/MocA family protein [Gemmataceae bacterium]
MALDVSPEEKAIGEENFHRAVGKLGVSRRQFMGGLLATGAALPIGAAAYYGYNKSEFPRMRPVKAGLIGAGDEGGVLVGEHNPEFVEFVAYSDIRPYNQKRIFTGDMRKVGDKLQPHPSSPRKGFNYHYGNDAAASITLHEDYRDLLNDDEIELVVIALPLHLHAPVTIDALNAGKHVLCEKLMAWNVKQCKQMIQAAERNNKLLAIGHQRHYSMLYAHALEVIKSGVMGDIHHIRALWHRNNTKALPTTDPRYVADDPYARYKDSWRPAIYTPEKLTQAGYTGIDPDTGISEATLRQAGFKDLKEFIRWRLYDRTGGGLMAELGSHQLDACSIFLGGVRPIAVSSVGGKYFYEDDREVEDHVFCTYEFPGPKFFKEGIENPDHTNSEHIQDRNDVVVVTYSSINTNDFEGYGECVMGTRGTLVVEKERSAMLWGLGSRSTKMGVNTSGGQAAIDTYASDYVPTATENADAARGRSSVGDAISRGYREEMEHLAYIIRMQDQGMESDQAQLKPRCGGRKAMADAIMALTANVAMANKQRIEFDSDWYDVAKLDKVPDDSRNIEGPLPPGEAADGRS